MTDKSVTKTDSENSDCWKLKAPPFFEKNNKKEISVVTKRKRSLT